MQDEVDAKAVCELIRKSGALGSSETLASQLACPLSRVTQELETRIPGAHLEPLHFASFVIERYTKAGTPATLELLDLALVAACCDRNRAAMAHLDAIVEEEAPIALARFRHRNDRVEDVPQTVRVKLLVSQEGALPPIAGYLGKGPFRAWLRAVLVRHALNAVSGPPREQSLESWIEEEGLPRDPELDYLRTRHRADFADAFAWAIEQLTDRERVLLSLHVVQNLSLDRIGGIYSISKATAGRWTAAARERLLENTHAFLGKRLGLSEAGLRSFLRIVDGDLDLSVRRLLAPKRP